MYTIPQIVTPFLATISKVSCFSSSLIPLIDSSGFVFVKKIDMAIAWN